MHQAREQKLGTNLLEEIARCVHVRPCIPCHRRLAILHRLPNRIVDDLQIRHVLGDDCVVGIVSGAPLARKRILGVAEPVPDETADIEFVVEDEGRLTLSQAEAARRARRA